MRPPRGPDKGPRKGSPRVGRPGPRAGLRAPRDPKGARRAAALTHLADGLLPRVAADRIGVSQATVYNWMRETSFAAELHHELEARRAAARAYAAARACDLIGELVALAMDEPSPAPPQVVDVPGVPGGLEVDVEKAEPMDPGDLAKLRMVRVLALRESLRIAGVDPPKELNVSVTSQYAMMSDTALLKKLAEKASKLLAPPPEEDESEDAVVVTEATA